MSASLVALLTCVTGGAPAPEFLDQHDPIWEVAPVRWLDGIPLANGHIGAMIWGDGAPLKITLDRYDAWETRERVLGEGDITYAKLRHLVADGKRKEAENCLDKDVLSTGDAPYPTRLPLPRLELGFGKPIEWQEARLSLRTATATLAGRLEGQPLTVKIAVDATRNILVIRMTGKGSAAPAPHVGLNHLDENAKRLLKSWGYPVPEITDENLAGTLHVKAPTGYEYAIAWERRVGREGDGQLICLALLSNQDNPDPLNAAKTLAGEACRANGDLAAHEAWWSDYWKRSYLTIPDARLEALYFIEMYKLGASTRPGGYPITLQALWTLDGGMPPWSGDYHLDMNVQQTYWPIYTANHLELGEPLYRTFSACIPRWRAECNRFFGFDGICSGASIGPHGERIFGYSPVQMWPGSAAWLAHHYWLHYLYSQDEQFLREQALPIIRLAFLTYANLLEPGDDGKLHVPLSNSPEWGEGSFDAFRKDPTCDLMLIRFLANAILKSNEALGVEDELTPRVRQVLEKLTDCPRQGDRLLVGAGTPLSHSHRHFSHLMGIHPLGVLTRETDGALIRGSLTEVRERGTGEWTGWSFPWMSLIASRAGYGNMAWQMLDSYANCFIKPNTFHVNGDPRIFGLSLFDYEPMTLEAGFGAAAAIMEMLLQSYNGRIRVFPTMPDRWHDAYFAGLRAEGAFLVTAKRVAGAVPFVIIQSEKGRRCELANPFGAPAEVARLGQEGSPTAPEGEVLAFDTQPNAQYLVYPRGKKPTERDVAPSTFPRGELEQNFYGLKRLPQF